MSKYVIPNISSMTSISNSSMEQKVQRASNIEILRILSMMMVLVLHVNVSSLAPLGIAEQVINLVNVLCIAAVNIFVSISGYFSIRFSFRRLLKFYLQCCLMGISAYVLCIIVTQESFSLRHFCGRFLAFSHNHWWFVISYLGLMFLSPLLNKGAESISKKDFQVLLLLFGVIEVYFGWYKGLDGFNTGLSIIHFCYVYLLARYVALHISIEKIIRYRWLHISMCFLCVAINYYIAESGSYVSYLVLSYNNPFIIIGALSVVLFFLSFSFRSKWINWISASAFAAYLLQENPYVGHKFYYAWESTNLSQYTNVYSLYGMTIVHCVAFFILAVLIDKLCGVIINYCLQFYEYVEKLIITNYRKIK